jgi:hypothetical protein
MKKLSRPLTPKTAAISVLALATLLAVSYGAWELYARLTNRPPTTSDVKQSIRRFLKKETGQSDFQTEFGPASISNAVTEVAVTNKNGKVKKNARRKISELGLPETSLTAYFRTNHAAATSYREMYQLIGQQLTIADELLESDDLSRKQSALVVASEASAYARNDAMNLWLAARICEGYLWPNLSLVESTNKPPFTPDALLNLCDIAFKEAGETQNIIRNYEYLIAKASVPQRADSARFRVARLYEEIGDEERALQHLKQIKTLKNAKVERQIAALEQRLKSKSR